MYILYIFLCVYYIYFLKNIHLMYIFLYFFMFFKKIMYNVNVQNKKRCTKYVKYRIN